MLLADPYPPSDFYEWAGHYDESINDAKIPFTGYWRVLSEVIRLADVRLGMTVLDLGTGTGNLAALFASSACTGLRADFSTAMLK